MNPPFLTNERHIVRDQIQEIFGIFFHFSHSVIICTDKKIESASQGGFFRIFIGT
ncbi:hypothetical protein HC660_27590 [Bacillus mojavensis]|uniref:Uncharacterized protein n=1 Tax=Bacillus mojavensis TaxID=72360 RepID=A0ABX6LZA9_BACMO|nr:hypothetical protein HC660_27590 [Bacillus mojavensis]